MTKHSFAVCAYGESPYLEACVRSLLRQDIPTPVILCTSTPNAYIRGIAEKYELPLLVRDGESGIGTDWTFAFNAADSEFVTLAHQDDLYSPHYTARFFRALKRRPDLTLFMAASVSVKNGAPERHNGLPETIKLLLRLPLRLHALCSLPMIKRAAVMFGNPIICPSIAYRKAAAGSSPFREDLKFVLDWLFLWEQAAGHGRWYMEERPLMLYRVHEGAATAACIRDHVREREETEMFCRIWPKPVAALIMRYYRRSYEAYGEKN